MKMNDLHPLERQRLNSADKIERIYKKSVKAEYTAAYQAMKEALITFIVKYGTDGKLGNDAYKYNRYSKLVKNVTSNLESIQKVRPRSVEAYLKNQYIDGYLRSGFELEQKYKTKLVFREPVRNAINPLSITDEISLQNNAKMVRININQAIKQSIASGDGIQGTTARVKKALEQNMNDAVRIAQTETTTAVNDAAQNAMWKAADIVPIKKQWVAIMDDRTRDRHRMMDGEMQEIPYAFSNGLMYPGDQSGSASEVTNCRCRMREIIEGYKDAQDYMKKNGIDPNTIPFDSYEQWAKNRL